ncbi:pickpocket protein 28 isoform X2 [Aedes aegypti]|uniref:Uncharacterized protein n=1 Tax=Aedes aegypti TaxID=7159 RepID=A0A6R5HRJ7_AEDAE|nr:pickpocket protein 28 isoform X2 [Aedes aegypti]
MCRIISTWKRLNKEWQKENSIRAYAHLANRRLTLFERIFWFACIIATAVACWLSVSNVYTKWRENPVVIAYAPRFSPVSTIPFPAITICPLTKTRVEAFNLSEVYEIVSKGAPLDEVKEKQLRALAHVCPCSNHWRNYSAVADESIVETLQNISLPFEETLLMCLWQTKRVPCRHLFTETLVDDGICYTFNELLSNETYRTNAISRDFTSFGTEAVQSRWSLETGYEPQAGLYAFPRRALSNGFQAGLTVMPMVRKIDQEFLCRGPYTGYKFAVHSPGEIPLTGDKFYRLNTLNSITLTITPRITKTSQELRSVAPSRRRCFFNDERPLRFFRTYSSNNCFLECIANFTLEKCHCVKFSMPRTADTKVCDASKIDCYFNIYQDMYRHKVANALSGNKCNCLPPCNSLEYDVEMSQFPFNFHELATAMRMPAFEYDQMDAAVMFVGLKARHYLPMWRRELMGITDAVAKLGGIFALLLGASMLTFAECVYYHCVRPLRRENVRNGRVQNVRTAQRFGFSSRPY